MLPTIYLRKHDNGMQGNIGKQGLRAHYNGYKYLKKFLIIILLHGIL